MTDPNYYAHVCTIVRVFFRYIYGICNLSTPLCVQRYTTPSHTVVGKGTDLQNHCV